MVVLDFIRIDAIEGYVLISSIVNISLAKVPAFSPSGAVVDTGMSCPRVGRGISPTVMAPSLGRPVTTGLEALELP